MEGSAHERFDCEERGGEAPGGCDGRRPGSRAHALPGLCGGGSHLTASASEQEAAAPLPAGALAGTSTDTQDEGDGADSGAAVAPDGGQAPEAEVQSAATAAADGGAGGTTISIQVYRSSFPILDWVLVAPDDKDIDRAPSWAQRPEDLPKSASPGQLCSAPADYDRSMEPQREGYVFAGWSLDPNASKGQFLDGLTMPDGAPAEKGYTLYALWVPEVYSVVFDLARNPDNGSGPLAETSFELNWSDNGSTERTVSSLGEGRYKVRGFTVLDGAWDPDYVEATGLIVLPEPARSGYRFLGWAEPDGQLISRDAGDGAFGMALARLPQIDGTPVLTARWTSAFGVTAPLSITFGDYDKTGAPGNPWLGDEGIGAGDDTTQSEADDTTKDEQSGYEALGQAYFENTSWHASVKVVGLTSARSADANQVLTTYDSKQASEAQVLGSDDEPGERLLSLYPSSPAPADKSSGVHFRLQDALGEEALGDSFVMGEVGSGGEKRPITYGLNLSTDPADGSANHGLVLPTNDYERKQIATVSYTFTTSETAATQIAEAFWTLDDNGRTLGLDDIKADATAIAAGDADTKAKYTRWMKADHRFYVRWYDQGEVESSDAAATIYEVRIIGIGYDSIDVAGTKKAGLTFQFVDLMNRTGDASIYRFNNVASSDGGWFYSEMRRKMHEAGTTGHAEDWGDRSLDGVIWDMVPAALQQAIQTVIKHAQNSQAPGLNQSFSAVSYMSEQLFLVSYAEIATTLSNTGNFSGTASAYLNARPFNGSGARMAAPYDFYAQYNIVGENQYAILKKGEQRYRLPDGTYSTYHGWFQRDTYPNYTDIFKSTNLLGDATNLSYNSRQPASAGVCPAFCL